MQIDCALLCDAATVREGLLHVLGGGVTRAGRPEYPSSLDLTLALRILVHPTEADRPHNLEVRLQGADGQEITQIGVQFGVRDQGDLAPGESVSLPLPLKLPQDVVLPEPGSYSFEVLIDGNHQTSVGFIATEVELPEVEIPEGGE